MNQLAVKVRQRADRDQSCVELLASLKRVVEGHVREEEQDLFPRVEKSLGPS